MHGNVRIRRFLSAGSWGPAPPRQSPRMGWIPHGPLPHGTGPFPTDPRGLQSGPNPVGNGPVGSPARPVGTGVGGRAPTSGQKNQHDPDMANSIV